jgi:hypothetical protein
LCGAVNAMLLGEKTENCEILKKMKRPKIYKQSVLHRQLKIQKSSTKQTKIKNKYCKNKWKAKWEMKRQNQQQAHHVVLVSDWHINKI